MLDFYIDGGPASILDFNVNVAWASLILVTPIYVALYMYLDAIMPNVYGIRQSCCFCLKKKKLILSLDDEEALDA